ncbi:hypothetical protein MMC06_006409 [Schaereria dolodes]|nr:hypothetical protein [Schaereria dolodes]
MKPALLFEQSPRIPESAFHPSHIRARNTLPEKSSLPISLSNLSTASQNRYSTTDQASTFRRVTRTSLHGFNSPSRASAQSLLAGGDHELFSTSYSYPGTSLWTQRPDTIGSAGCTSTDSIDFLCPISPSVTSSLNPSTSTKLTTETSSHALAPPILSQSATQAKRANTAPIVWLLTQTEEEGFADTTSFIPNTYLFVGPTQEDFTGQTYPTNNIWTEPTNSLSTAGCSRVDGFFILCPSSITAPATVTSTTTADMKTSSITKALASSTSTLPTSSSLSSSLPPQSHLSTSTTPTPSPAPAPAPALTPTATTTDPIVWFDTYSNGYYDGTTGPTSWQAYTWIFIGPTQQSFTGQAYPTGNIWTQPSDPFATAGCSILNDAALACPRSSTIPATVFVTTVSVRGTTFGLVAPTTTATATATATATTTITTTTLPAPFSDPLVTLPTQPTAWFETATEYQNYGVPNTSTIASTWTILFVSGTNYFFSGQAYDTTAVQAGMLEASQPGVVYPTSTITETLDGGEVVTTEEVYPVFMSYRTGSSGVTAVGSGSGSEGGSGNGTVGGRGSGSGVITTMTATAIESAGRVGVGLVSEVITGSGRDTVVGKQWPTYVAVEYEEGGVGVGIVQSVWTVGLVGMVMGWLAW